MIKKHGILLLFKKFHSNQGSARLSVSTISRTETRRDSRLGLVSGIYRVSVSVSSLEIALYLVSVSVSRSRLVSYAFPCVPFCFQCTLVHVRIWPWLNSLVLKTWKFVAPYLEMNPCASLSVSLGLDQKSAVSVSVSTSETFRSQSQSRVSTRQGSGLSLSLNPKNLGLVGCCYIGYKHVKLELIWSSYRGRSHGTLGSQVHSTWTKFDLCSSVLQLMCFLGRRRGLPGWEWGGGRHQGGSGEGTNLKRVSGKAAV